MSFINTIETLGDVNAFKAFVEDTLVDFNDDVLDKIPSYAFYGSDILSVNVPNVTVIDNGAFEKSQLQTISAPQVLSIGNAVFSNSALQRIEAPLVMSIGDEAFKNCVISSVDFPMCESIGNEAFYFCKITSANLHNVKTIKSEAFIYSELERIELPLLQIVSSSSFSSCRSLKYADFAKATSIEKTAFNNCNSLVCLVLRSETLCSLANTMFTYCPVRPGGYSSLVGYIYVPRALVESYKVATNWSTYAASFRAIEDYTVDGTLTGAIDMTKI